jgi:hypothetical protein
VPNLPTNMICRKDRPGYWFRGRLGGKIRQISLGTDYQEALRRLRSLKSDGLPRADLTVSVAAERWLELYVTTRRTAGGLRDARSRVQRYLAPFIGHILLDELTRQDLWKYRTWLDQQRLRPATVYHVLSDCRCMLLWHEKPFPRRLMPKLRKEPVWLHLQAGVGHGDALGRVVQGAADSRGQARVSVDSRSKGPGIPAGPVGAGASGRNQEPCRATRSFLPDFEGVLFKGRQSSLSNPRVSPAPTPTHIRLPVAGEGKEHRGTEARARAQLDCDH